MYTPGDIIQHGQKGIGQVIEANEQYTLVSFNQTRVKFVTYLFRATVTGHQPLPTAKRERHGARIYGGKVRQPNQGTPSGQPCLACKMNPGAVYSPYANGKYCSKRCAMSFAGMGNTGRKKHGQI